MDDANSNAFNVTLADGGYIVRVVGADGFKKDFNSSQVKLNDNVIVANRMNGAPLESGYWPLRLVGEGLASGQMVRNIAEIQIIF